MLEGSMQDIKYLTIKVGYEINRLWAIQGFYVRSANE